VGLFDTWNEWRREREHAHLAMRHAMRLEQSLRDVEALRIEVERLRRLIGALWSLVRERLGLEDVDLARIVDADPPDSAAIAAARSPATCERCGRATSRRLPKCIYCDAPLPRTVS